VEFCLDTGAQVTVLTYSTFCSLGLPIVNVKSILTGADGKRLDICGGVELFIKNRKKNTTCLAYVVNGANRNLLGADQILDLGLLIVVNSVCENAFNVFQCFPKLFQGLGTMPGEFSISLKEDTVPVCLYAPRNIAAGLRDKAKEELDKMLSLGVVEPVEEPTEWCSGLTIAPKSNGGIRMCVDLTALNKGVKRSVYPLPKVSDMLAKLATGRVFSKLDANSGFWQVKMDPSCKTLTTFITPWGRYCFKRMPFGISSAPEFYQRCMEKILLGLEGVICLMDDVLVFADDSYTHWRRLREVLNRIEKSGMTLRKDKCEFGVQSVKFLGHLVSSDGIKPDPEKVKAIMEMNPPCNKKEARRFMGMVNYLSKFSKNLSELCVPIFSVMGQKSEWYWGVEQQRSFDMIKTELSNTPVLCAFDLRCKHRVSADSSQYALGAVLLQLNCRGDWQPVEYASRKLTEAESRYAMVEKEALAVTWACSKLDFYLVGREFEIETDHKPLVAILGEKDLSKLPLRVQRFKLQMMRYSYTIFHTPGKKMYLADSLSRPCDIDGECIKHCSAVECFVQSNVQHLLDDVRERELLQAIKSDVVSQQCLSFIANGWPSGYKYTGEILKLYNHREEITSWRGMILCHDRLYIPCALRSVYLHRLHDHHQGVEKTRLRAKELIWWPGWSSDIAAFIAECNTCIKNGVIKHQPHQETELPKGPWEEVAVDVFVFTGNLYLVIVDYYTRWIEAPSLTAQTSSVVIGTLKSVFSRLGVPSILRSDNGPCFKSYEFSSFADAWGFSHVTSSPLYPQSNGMAERAVGTIKRFWRMNVDKEGALLAYRSTPLKSGFSPNQLMFGRAVRSQIGKSEVPVDYGLFERNEEERRRDIRQKWDSKYRAKPLPKLTPGQRVWINSPTDIGKEGVVLRADSKPESYWVRVGLSEIRRNRKHLFLLHDTPNFSDMGSDMRPMELDDPEEPPGSSDQSDVSKSGVDNPNVMLSPAMRTSVVNSPMSADSSANLALASDLESVEHADNLSEAHELTCISLPDSASSDSVSNTLDNSSLDISNASMFPATNDVGVSEPSTAELFTELPFSQMVVTRSGRASVKPKRDGFLYY